MNNLSWQALKRLVDSKTSHGKNQILDEMVKLEMEWVQKPSLITKNELLLWFQFKVYLAQRTVHSKAQLLAIMESLEHTYLRGKSLESKLESKPQYIRTNEAATEMHCKTIGSSDDAPF
jgi:hypothetical protein